MEAGPSQPPDGTTHLLQRELTGRLLKIFFDVYNELGAGFLESVYASAFAYLLREEGVPFEREATAEVFFRSASVGICRLDFLVDRSVVVECKAVGALDSAHRGQLLHYLRATGLEVGLLLNFGPVPEFKRIANSARRRPDSPPRPPPVP